MIRRVYPEQIRPFWESIKYGITQVNRISDSKQLPQYLINVLTLILTEVYQAWVCIGENNVIKGVALTEMCKDSGGIKHLMINTLYGYSQMTKEDRVDFLQIINELAQANKCNKIFAKSSNPIAMNALQNIGFIEADRIFTKDVEGGLK